MQQLTDTPTNGIAEMIMIAVIDGRIGDVMIFIIDQINLGHRDKIAGAIGEDLVRKIEAL
jgi:hypothetical protein